MIKPRNTIPVGHEIPSSVEMKEIPLGTFEVTPPKPTEIIPGGVIVPGPNAEAYAKLEQRVARLEKLFVPKSEDGS